MNQFSQAQSSSLLDAFARQLQICEEESVERLELFQESVQRLNFLKHVVYKLAKGVRKVAQHLIVLRMLLEFLLKVANDLRQKRDESFFEDLCRDTVVLDKLLLLNRFEVFARLGQRG